MVKAVIFDIDETLIHSVDLHAAAWQDALPVPRFPRGRPRGGDEWTRRAEERSPVSPLTGTAGAGSIGGAQQAEKPQRRNPHGHSSRGA
jgi:FMN phosphatase YigB (HAD superfamily)